MLLVKIARIVLLGAICVCIPTVISGFPSSIRWVSCEFRNVITSHFEYYYILEWNWRGKQVILSNLSYIKNVQTNYIVLWCKECHYKSLLSFIQKLVIILIKQHVMIWRCCERHRGYFENQDKKVLPFTPLDRSICEITKLTIQCSN